MAKVKAFFYREKKRIKRKGVHSKTKASKMKHSKNYLKKYRQQGR